MSRKTAVAFDATTARKDPELRNTWDVLSAVRAGPRYVPSPRSRKENRGFCVTFFSSTRIDSPCVGSNRLAETGCRRRQIFVPRGRLTAATHTAPESGRAKTGGSSAGDGGFRKCL